MLARIREWLGSSRDHARSTGGVVTSARAAAYAELRAAEAAGDTRRIGAARMRLAQATHDQLANEVWG